MSLVVIFLWDLVTPEELIIGVETFEDRSSTTPPHSISMTVQYILVRGLSINSSIIYGRAATIVSIIAVPTTDA